jgi:hypothetical protein
VFIITESDIAQAVSSGAGAQQGLSVTNLAVKFAQDKMTVSADQLSYTMLRVSNLKLVGKLVAVDGKLQLRTESITPAGLVTGFIPTLANQALAQYTSAWFIEEVRTTDGKLEIRIR